MTTAPLMMLYLTATPSPASVIVGHPVPWLMEPDPTVEIDYAEAPVAKLVLVDDLGESHVEELYTTFDLLDSSTIDMPPGTWMEATVVLDGPIRVGGTGNDGSFHLELDVEQIVLQMPDPVCTVDEVPTTALHIGGPSWLTAARLGLQSGQHLIVDATHALHDDLRDSVRYDSSWY